MRTIVTWLKTYEFVAIWLEGIALVAIFIWDRIEGHQQHKETLAQLRVSQQQADALVSSERAWIMVEAQRHANTLLVGMTGSDVHTSLPLDLVCTNVGKTPAWITEKRMVLIFVDAAHPLPKQPDLNIEVLDPEPEPLQSGQHSSHGYMIQAEGQQAVGKMLIVFGVVKYRHLFSEAEVQTTFGYQISASDILERLSGYPEYNKNT